MGGDSNMHYDPGYEVAHPEDDGQSISEQVEAEFADAHSLGAQELPEGTHKFADTPNPPTSIHDVREIAREVARCEGIITGEGQDVHHVTPLNEIDEAGLLNEVRDRLESEGVDIGTDPANLAALPSRDEAGRVNGAFAIHEDVHDNIDGYSRELFDRIEAAPPGEARAELASFNADLIEGRISFQEPEAYEAAAPSYEAATPVSDIGSSRDLLGDTGTVNTSSTDFSFAISSADSGGGGDAGGS